MSRSTLPRVSKVSEQWEACASRLLPGFSKDSVQYTEMRKTFYAGFGQCLLASRYEIGHQKRTDQEGAEIFQALLEEVDRFWREEQKRFDTKKAEGRL